VAASILKKPPLLLPATLSTPPWLREIELPSSTKDVPAVCVTIPPSMTSTPVPPPAPISIGPCTVRLPPAWTVRVPDVPAAEPTLSATASAAVPLWICAFPPFRIMAPRPASGTPPTQFAIVLQSPVPACHVEVCAETWPAPRAKANDAVDNTPLRTIPALHLLRSRV